MKKGSDAARFQNVEREKKVEVAAAMKHPNPWPWKLRIT